MQLHGRLLVAAALAMPIIASAAPLDDYLAVRKANGILQPASPAALETFVGERIIEVRGEIKGFIGSDDSKLLILESPDTRELYIKAKGSQVDWMGFGPTEARMIIKATRATETSLIKAELIAAVSEKPMADHERKVAASKPQPKPPTTAKANTPPPRTGGSQTSRAGTANRTTGNPITGPIGKSQQSLAPEILACVPAYADFIQTRNKKLARDKAEHIAETVLAYSVHYGVDARLIMAIVLVESGFKPEARSHAGAQGLGQLMPGTARGLGVTNAYDTEQNLFGTVKLIRGHIDKYTGQTGDLYEGLILALAAYNAGSGNVRKYGGVPPFKETQNYVKKVTDAYRQLCGY